VTQNEYLDLIRRVRSATQHRQSEQVSKQPVEEGEGHPTIMPTPPPTDRTEFPAPSGQFEAIQDSWPEELVSVEAWLPSRIQTSSRTLPRGAYM
jgi:hypothetical protein